MSQVETLDPAMAEAMGAATLQVTPEYVDSMIKEKTFLLHPCKSAMTCTIVLHNGFRLFGYNTCLDRTKYDLAYGEEASFNEARNQVFSYAAYQILEDNFRGNAPLSDEQRKLPDHIQRVIREFFQTMARLQGLSQFLYTFGELSAEEAANSGISPEEILDLKTQEVIMGRYVAILQRRLDRAGI